MFSQIEVPTHAGPGLPPAVLDTLQQVIARLAEPLDALASIGVASGDSVAAPALGWRDGALASTLSAKFGVPVTVENDARAAAWGEFRFGGHRARSLLAVFVGTGVGSGAVLDGRLWTGGANGAGELGHTLVVPEGLACVCGGHGCLEQYASAGGFRRRLRTALGEGMPTALREATGGDADTLTADMVAAAANSGDPLARTLWTDARRYLTLAVANYVTLVNPETLVLGGDVLDGVPELFDELTGGILAGTTVLGRESLRIEHSRLGEWAGVLGAAGIVLGGGFRPPSDGPRTPGGVLGPASP